MVKRIGRLMILTVYACMKDISVEDHKVHEDFTTKSTVITNNIALLRLKEPIDFSFKNVAPICLPISKTSRNISLESKTVTLAGWKLRKIEDSCDLSKTNLPVVTRNECQKKYETLTTSKNVRISEDQLCADEQTNDACGIVSGAPLMLEADHQGSRRIVQYGLSSHGPNRCMSSYPGVYTDVTKHVDWILSNIKE